MLSFNAGGRSLDIFTHIYIMFCSGSAPSNVGGEFTQGQPSSRKHCQKTKKREKAAYNKLNTELAKEQK
jgi:hypothetical protein